MLQKIVNKKNITNMLFVLGVIALGVGAYMLATSLMDTSANAPVAPTITDPNQMRDAGLMPHQMADGPYSPGKTITCASKQMDKLDDCDVDDTPDYGEDWVSFVKNQ